MKELFYIALLLLGFSLGYYVKSDRVIERIDSVTVAVDTNQIISEYYAEMKVKLRAELKPSVIKIKEKVNIDSLWNEAKRYAIDSLYAVNGDYLYIASLDTTMNDSVSSIRARVDIISQIPIHPSTLIQIDLRSDVWSLDSVKTVYKEVIVEVDKPFYKNLWFYGTVGATLLAIFR